MARPHLTSFVGISRVRVRKLELHHVRMRLATVEMAEEEKIRPQTKSDEPAGIPEAVFVEDVEAFMQLPGNSSAEVVLRRFDDQHNKYKFMEANLKQKKQRLKAKIPDIQKTLDVVRFLKSRQGSGDPHTSHFMLSEGVFVTADIPPTDTVFLWLGANVMLEYPIATAEQLLCQNLTQAESSLRQVDEGVDRIRDQCTTLEVGMARVYNWDVKERRKKKGTVVDT